MSARKTLAANVPGRRNVWIEVLKNKEIYLLALPAIAWYIVFCYMPMGGLTLAFKSFKTRLGILASPWNGTTNFESLFRDPAFFRSVGITLWINFIELLLCFPAPILLALMLNELRMRRYKKLLQTVYTFPHFLSWVIVGSIVKNLLSVDGVVNGLMAGMGLEKVSFLGNKDLFRPLIYISEIWKEAGWSSIIYLAAISGIDPQLYEVAEIDGAKPLPARGEYHPAEHFPHHCGHVDFANGRHHGWTLRPDLQPAKRRHRFFRGNAQLVHLPHYVPAHAELWLFHCCQLILLRDQHGAADEHKQGGRALWRHGPVGG